MTLTCITEYRRVRRPYEHTIENEDEDEDEKREREYEIKYEYVPASVTVLVSPSRAHAPRQSVSRIAHLYTEYRGTLIY
jgi:hypothetical protein